MQTNEMLESADSRNAMIAKKKHKHAWPIPARMQENPGRRDGAAVGGETSVGGLQVAGRVRGARRESGERQPTGRSA